MRDDIKDWERKTCIKGAMKALLRGKKDVMTPNFSKYRFDG